MPVVTKVSYVENKGQDIELQKTRWKTSSDVFNYAKWLNVSFDFNFKRHEYISFTWKRLLDSKLFFGHRFLHWSYYMNYFTKENHCDVVPSNKNWATELKYDLILGNPLKLQQIEYFLLALDSSFSLFYLNTDSKKKCKYTPRGYCFWPTAVQLDCFLLHIWKSDLHEKQIMQVQIMQVIIVHENSAPSILKKKDYQLLIRSLTDN